MSDEKKKDDKRILKRFGRYLILDHLVDGGMAKICRARFLGEQADKIVAIKMVQPQYSKDENFVKMFMDEIKVTFGLIHPNIAQTYDTGMIDGQLFAAMEYVDGKNLKQFLDRLKDRKFVFPVEISAYITSQVCQALNYAHNFQDKLTGKQLKIIHRDISPHNIMLTYDGSVKIIDFGIAKADTNSDATQAGTIKGKLSYLAPEYLDGKELDTRYDQFAVGITLWELLCSRKLFKAPNELAVLKLIQACKVPPPSSINPNVPRELDEIVLKALSRDRKKRYETMDQFNRALVKFLYSNYPDFNPTDLACFAKELFKDEITADRARLFDFGKINIEPFLSDLREELKGGGAPRSDSQRTVKTIKVKGRGSKDRQMKMLDFDFEDSINEGVALDEEGTENTGALKSQQRSKIDQPLQLEGNSNASVASDLKKTRLTETKGRAHFTQTKKQRTSTNDKNRKHDSNRKSEVSSKKTINPIAVALALVVGLGYWYFDQKTATRDPAGVSPSQATTIEDEKRGILSFTNTSINHEFFLNGESISYTGGKFLKVDLDKDLYVEVKEKGRKTFRKTVRLTEENLSTDISIPKMPEVFHGELVSDLNFTDNDILIIETEDGQINRRLPIEDPISIAEGTYEAVIKNTLFETKKVIKIEIQANRRFRLKKP